ncbi:hypothetical protein [Pseudactinotalea sp. Z1732]|uniref:hypothetical protein n=1 Tax=Pseudactinotalea sp. Z1732 TaxID=3413026 RepID=UPI003C7AD2EB
MTSHTDRPHPDQLAALAGRRRRNLFITTVILEVIGFTLVVLGWVVVEEMTLVWVGAGLVLLAAVYLPVGLVALSRVGADARHITPPGGRT